MFDIIIIGGGPGGYGAAEFAAHHGLSVALVERDSLGGTCLNRGCVPTKAYLHAAEVVSEATPFAPGIAASFDRQAMFARKNEIVQTLVKGIEQLMKAGKVAVYQGHGTLMNAAEPFEVSVTAPGAQPQTLAGRHVLLATGSAPTRIPVPGCDNPAVWTSDDLLSAVGAEAFKSLLVIGGGVIGVEIASIYARLGTQVTVVEAENRFVPMLDIDLSRSAETMLRGMGVVTLTGARLQTVTQTADGTFNAAVEQNGVSTELSADRVLLATGRVPVTDALLAQGVTLAMQKRNIGVDAHYRTSLEGVYAIGDVNGQMQLAHAAHAQGIAAVSHMLGIPSPVNPMLVPSCVYTAPEIASVGLTAAQAKEQGLAIVTGKALTTQNARTLIEGLGRGFIKLVFDQQTRRLLGAQLFCGRATDLIGELTMAVENGLTAAQMLAPLRPHPTFEEAITDAVMAAKFD